MESITTILEKLGIDFRRAGESKHVTQGWIGVVCPFCGQGTTNYGMGMPLNGFVARCWKCGSHPLPKALQALSGAPWAAIKELLSGLSRTAWKPVERLGRIELPLGLGPLLKPHRTYLRGRGFDPDSLAMLWGVQGIGLASSLSWRLFIPVTYLGVVVSWTTRSLVDDGIRYLSAPPKMEALPHKSLLYGEDMVTTSIIIHEGPADVWATGPGSVATFGDVPTQAQISKMSKYPRRCVCFDSEPEARRRAQALCAQLAVFTGVTERAEMESSKDPGGADSRELAELRKRFLE